MVGRGNVPRERPEVKCPVPELRWELRGVSCRSGIIPGMHFLTEMIRNSCVRAVQSIPVHSERCIIRFVAPREVRQERCSGREVYLVRGVMHCPMLRCSRRATFLYSFSAARPICCSVLCARCRGNKPHNTKSFICAADYRRTQYVAFAACQFETGHAVESEMHPVFELSTGAQLLPRWPRNL